MSCIDSYEDSEDSEEDDDGEDDEGAQEAVQEASDPADFKDFFLDDWKDFSQEDLERVMRQKRYEFPMVTPILQGEEGAGGDSEEDEDAVAAPVVVSTVKISGSGRFLDLSRIFSMTHDVCDACRSITHF